MFIYQSDAFVKVSAHCYAIASHFILHVHVLQELACHFFQRLRRPLREPVQRGAVDQRGKHSEKNCF
jgi:hypothetical protein